MDVVNKAVEMATCDYGLLKGGLGRSGNIEYVSKVCTISHTRVRRLRDLERKAEHRD